MQRPIFEAKGIQSQTQLQIQRPPWLLWGQPIISHVSASVLPDNRGDLYYEAWVRITRSPFVSSVGFDISTPESFQNGDSGILLTEGMDFGIGIYGDAPNLLLGKDANNVLSHFYFPHVTASSIEAALEGVSNVARQVIWTLTLTAAQPLFSDALLVASMDRLQFRAEIRAAAPAVELSTMDAITSHRSLRPYVSQYIEGIRSSSPLYSFLCYFKICERLNRVRPRIRKICERYNITPPSVNGVFPEDPIAYVNAEAIGKKYTAELSRLQDLYRNSIAHLNPNEDIEPLVDAVRESQVRTASCLLRYAAFDMINQIIAALSTIRDTGVDLALVSF
jgi:hypothetical protein